MITIIGVDCATKPGRVGIARGRAESDALVIEEVVLGSKERDPASVAADWLAGRERVLLALDAPLGWPQALGPALSQHRAGAPIAASADRLFRRETDEEIRRRLGKAPLEVGANLIARTARAALELLDAIRRESGHDIPLVWEPQFDGVGAIEVYPAATLKARGLKNSDRCLNELSAEFALAGPIPDSAHARDAVLCVLGGFDFVSEKCGPPADRGLAEREGWIWAPCGASR